MYTKYIMRGKSRESDANFDLKKSAHQLLILIRGAILIKIKTLLEA